MDAIHFNLVLFGVTSIGEGRNTVDDRIDPGWDEAGRVPGCKKTERFADKGDEPALVETGPTWTNVNDFRAIVVDRP